MVARSGISRRTCTRTTALIRALDVHNDVQRRGIASALYETFRGEHPDVLVDHSCWRREDARAWWAVYCTRRNLDPASPRS